MKLKGTVQVTLKHPMVVLLVLMEVFLPTVASCTLRLDQREVSAHLLVSKVSFFLFSLHFFIKLN